MSKQQLEIPDLGEDYRVLHRAQGLFMGYHPSTDGHIEDSERERIHQLKGCDNRPHDFKLHLNPRDDQLHMAARSIIDLCRERQPLRTALHDMKFWFGWDEPEYDDVPRLVLYPRDGRIVNVIQVARAVLPALGDLGVTGSGRQPRFNMPIIDGFCFLAQGSGYDKESSPDKLSLYDPASNYAFLKGESQYTAQTIEMIRRDVSGHGIESTQSAN